MFVQEGGILPGGMHLLTECGTRHVEVKGMHTKAGNLSDHLTHGHVSCASPQQDGHQKNSSLLFRRRAVWTFAVSLCILAVKCPPLNTMVVALPIVGSPPSLPWTRLLVT